MQPTFNSWLGYYDMMDKVDLFVLYDDVQLVKRSWQVRNRIKTPQGELFLTIPILKSSSRDETLICDAALNDNEKWRSKHLKTMENAYGKAQHFGTIWPWLSSQYEQASTLGDFNTVLIRSIADKIGIKSNIVSASEIAGIEGAKDERLTNLCKYFGVTYYLSPQGSAVYIEADQPGGKLVENGITLSYHAYNHPTYDQLHGDFIPYMGIFDLLFNRGFEDALEIIRSGRADDIPSEVYRSQHMNL